MAKLSLPGVLLPASLPVERINLLRRCEHTANARREAKTLSACSNVFRGIVKDRMADEMYQHIRTHRLAKEERVERWVQKTADHPFHTDLWKEDEAVFRANKARDEASRRRTVQAQRRANEAHGLILSRAYSETDVLDELRREKRTMLENEKLVKAWGDVEKSHLRGAKALAQRKKAQFDKQQRELDDALRSRGG
eukprot:TRINITY_DN49555_c0_g1_i1.p2 TRINITY_DN49555_c0_g1~~TRINITY_DN49555_c0_g1_i1.p2  ORF type:complete len:195 (-),score=50.01 TRINITY_DN49555_c0_g1_i1:37-621(-)